MGKRSWWMGVFAAALLVAALCFAGCAGSAEDGKASEGGFCGTWEVDHLEMDGTSFTAEQIRALGGEEIAGFGMVLQEGGEAYLFLSDEGLVTECEQVANWEQTESGLKIGENELSFADGCLRMEYGEGFVCLTKASGSQEPPVPSTESAESEEGQGEQGAAAVDEGSSSGKLPAEAQGQDEAAVGSAGQSSDAGIDPDFKAAMDSYEAFFNEYVAFMEKYANSDDPTSMLADLAIYMERYAETMEKLEAIDEGELTNEEALYYAEVSSRISQKLINAAL